MGRGRGSAWGVTVPSFAATDRGSGRDGEWGRRYVRSGTHAEFVECCTAAAGIVSGMIRPRRPDQSPGFLVSDRLGHVRSPGAVSGTVAVNRGAFGADQVDALLISPRPTHRTGGWTTSEAVLRQLGVRHAAERLGFMHHQADVGGCAPPAETVVRWDARRCGRERGRTRGSRRCSGGRTCRRRWDW